MQSKLLHEASGLRTFPVVLATGDDVIFHLQEFVQRENIHAATFTAIGALSDAVLLYFNWEKKEYETIAVREQVEVAALIGDVADDPKGKPMLHRGSMRDTAIGQWNFLIGLLLRWWPTLNEILSRPAWLRCTAPWCKAELLLPPSLSIVLPARC